jgi:agmatine deiminase
MKRVPAEWEPQRAVWIAWPHNRQTWPGRIDRVPERFRELVSQIARSTPVRLLGDPALRGQAAVLLESTNVRSLADIQWLDVPTNDCWIRDYGPTFVVEDDRKAYAIDWHYNAWGGKYPPWDRDDAATAAMIEHAGWRRIEGGLCLEGGALEWDGSGRLLTTHDCLVTPSRNPGRSKDEIVATLQRLAGAREIVWVDGGGLQGDDTDGHIDQLARFIDPETVVVAACDDPADPNHAGLEANEAILRRWAETTSPNVSIHRLPIPPARFIDGTRVPESYCNFLRLGPDRLLVPSFGAAASDAAAVDLLTHLASQRSPSIEVVSIDCRDLVWGLGALHCASCDEPATTD